MPPACARGSPLAILASGSGSLDLVVTGFCVERSDSSSGSQDALASES